MREILFRAYQKNFKRMLPVTSIEFEYNNNRIWSITVDNRGVNGEYDVMPYNSTYIAGDEEFPLDSLVIMQYTGLKDKNGTRIFEGDIIEEGYNNMVGRWATKRWVMKWNQIEMAWMCYDSEISPYPTRASVVCANKNVIEVVGNIYDNKNIIK